MSTLTKPTQAISLEDRIARCIIQEIMRGNLSASFRLISAFPDDTAAQEQERARLLADLSERVTHLLGGQKRPMYRFKDIHIETIKNTIGITPIVQNRLQITVTVTRR